MAGLSRTRFKKQFPPEIETEAGQFTTKEAAKSSSRYRVVTRYCSKDARYPSYNKLSHKSR